MWIFFFIRIVVMATVDGNPQRRRELEGARSKDGQCTLEPKRAREATVRDEPVEANIDAKGAKQEYAGDEKYDPRPAEQPWK